MIKGIAHLAFQVTDMDRSVRFYETALGFKKKFTLYDDSGHPWILYLQVTKDQFIELFFAKGALTAKSSTTAFQHLCLEVTDISQIATDLIQKGIVLDRPVTLGLDHNWQCWIHDPDGNPIELMEYQKDALQLN